MGRFSRLQAIEQLDPVRDTCQICCWVAGYEFPWDMTRALELALFRTFCIPSVAQMLHQTQEFKHHGQKRYDDTGLIVSSLLKWGYDSERGQSALQRMNRIHEHFPIENADYLYVLSTFIYEPIRWIDHFGWRPLIEVEKQALFQFWTHVGQDMGIQDIPTTLNAFERYNQTYEQQYFCYSEASAQVGKATLTTFQSWFPAPLRPAITPWVYALLDDVMLEAFGWPYPSQFKRSVLVNVLKARSKMMRWLPPRSDSNFYIDMSHRSYPQGFQLKDIGPPRLLERLNQNLGDEQIN